MSRTQQTIDITELDSIVSSVLHQFVERAHFGKTKYGHTLDREDLTVLEWIEHAKQEHMDAILYLEKLKTEEMKRQPFNQDDDNNFNARLVIEAILIQTCVVMLWWFLYKLN